MYAGTNAALCFHLNAFNLSFVIVQVWQLNNLTGLLTTKQIILSHPDPRGIKSLQIRLCSFKTLRCTTWKSLKTSKVKDTIITTMIMCHFACVAFEAHCALSNLLKNSYLTQKKKHRLKIILLQLQLQLQFYELPAIECCSCIETSVASIHGYTLTAVM